MPDPIKPLSQVIVIITITGIDNDSQAHYTYTDPSMNGIRVEELKSQVAAVAPYSTLYALDYASTRDGWRIEGLQVRSGPPIIPCTLLNEGMAFITNYTAAGSMEHKFYLLFKNVFVNAPDGTPNHFRDDPQEGNIRRPT